MFTISNMSITSNISMDTYINEMITIANQEYEKTLENMTLVHEKKILQLQTTHETSKYDNVTSYFTILFNEKTERLDKEKVQQFPIFPDGFITTLQFDDEKHIQLLDSLDKTFLEDKHILDVKYKDIIRQLNECKKKQPVTSDTWFSIFENDEESSEEESSEESDEEEIDVEYETTKK